MMLLHETGGMEGRECKHIVCCAGLEEKEEEEVEGEDMEPLKDDAACCFTGHAGIDNCQNY